MVSLIDRVDLEFSILFLMNKYIFRIKIGLLKLGKIWTAITSKIMILDQ